MVWRDWPLFLALLVVVCLIPSSAIGQDAAVSFSVLDEPTASTDAETIAFEVLSAPPVAPSAGRAPAAIPSGITPALVTFGVLAAAAGAQEPGGGAPFPTACATPDGEDCAPAPVDLVPEIIKAKAKWKTRGGATPVVIPGPAPSASIPVPEAVSATPMASTIAVKRGFFRGKRCRRGGCP